MDLWSLKGKMVRHKPRDQKEKDALKFSAAAIAQKGTGHGAVYLDRKKQLWGEIHPEDKKKLQGALTDYAKRVEGTQKLLPEVPADID